MNDIKKAMEKAIYKRVVEVKDILQGYSKKELNLENINLKNIVDYVVINACEIDYYSIEDIEIHEVTSEGTVITAEGEEPFFIEDNIYYPPKTSFCMEILKYYFGLIEDFSSEFWTDTAYYGISQSCATMLHKIKETRLK